MTPEEKTKDKLKTLRLLLVGSRFFNASIALEYALKHHIGRRKDDSLEVDHQITMALFALTLPDILYREELICVIILHDVREDYNITDFEIRALFKDKEFANRVADAVEALTKVFRGVKKDIDKCFADIAADAIASISKGVDRIHNHQTMNSKKPDGNPAFSVKKQKEYIAETKEHFFSMLKVARKNFPEQYNAYQNIKFILQSQIELLECIHQVSEKV